MKFNFPGILLGLLFAVPLSSIAAIFDCAIETGRRGLQSVDMYINAENQAYLLLRFSDQRFDDTTEVYRIKGCAKISSGVTAKSTFETTLRGAGYSDYRIGTSGEVEIVNSVYGLSKVNATSDRVIARVEENDPNRIKTLQVFRQFVTLQVDLPLAALESIKDDPLIDRLAASEFSDSKPNELDAETLARLYFDIDSLLERFGETQVGSILKNQYSAHLISAVRNRVDVLDQQFINQLEIKYEALVNSRRTGSFNRALRGYERLKAIGFESERMIRTLFAEAAREVDINANLQAYQMVKVARVMTSSAALTKDVDLFLAAAYDKYIGVKDSPNVGAAKAGFIALHSAGYTHERILSRLVSTIKSHGSFGDAVDVFDKTKAIPVVDRLQGLAVTVDDAFRLERIAITTAASPSRFFHVEVIPSVGSSRRTEEQGQSAFFGMLPLTLYTLHGYLPAAAEIKVSRPSSLTYPLKYGNYRVQLEVEMRVIKTNYRRSSVIGNQEIAESSNIKKTAYINLYAPTMVGKTTIGFGDIEAVTVERGSSGGITHVYVSEEPVISAKIVGVEAL